MCRKTLNGIANYCEECDYFLAGNIMYSAFFNTVSVSWYCELSNRDEFYMDFHKNIAIEIPEWCELEEI